ncbi:MAG: DUF5333 domain-containing protein [Tabrizicola sp.]|nr:DUF5333 domain-containing protein [Tabrizicola sp.]
MKPAFRALQASSRHSRQPGASRLPGRVGMLTLGLLLGGCVDEQGPVSVAPPKGASAELALEEFAIAVATAEVIGDNCAPFGIKRAYRSSDTLIVDYVGGLQKQGYSLPEIERAVDSLSTEASISKAKRRAAAQGVREGDVASLCRYGNSEIAAGSTIGRLLRTSS